MTFIILSSPNMCPGHQRQATRQSFLGQSDFIKLKRSELGKCILQRSLILVQLYLGGDSSYFKKTVSNVNVYKSIQSQGSLVGIGLAFDATGCKFEPINVNVLV